MKTRTKLTKTIKSLTCLVLAAAMLFSGTADVQAAKKSTWKTVTLKDSQVDVEYIPYETKTLMELSEDGKTLTFTIATTEADGTERKSFNLKKLIPDDILAQFEDGKVYLYYTEGYKTFYEKDYDTETDDYSRSKQNTLAKKAANAYKKKLLKKSKYTNVKVTHYRDFNERFPENSEKGKHSNNEAVEDVIDGAYVVSYDELLSSSSGSGKIKSFYGSSGYYLADKNGEKIIDIEFQTYDIPETEGVTCSLSEVKRTKGVHGTKAIVLKSGESLSEKLELTGSCMAGVDYSKAIYDSSILTVKKDGTVTAKKGKYGVTHITFGSYETDCGYYIYVTDGSKKMFKALNKAFWNYGTILSLTISKNGKYTIERASWD